MAVLRNTEERTQAFPQTRADCTEHPNTFSNVSTKMIMPYQSLKISCYHVDIKHTGGFNLKSPSLYLHERTQILLMLSVTADY